MRTSFSMKVGQVQAFGHVGRQIDVSPAEVRGEFDRERPGLDLTGHAEAQAGDVARSSTPVSSSTFATALSICSNTADGPASGGGVASFARPTSFMSSSNRPARIFVPPRSTPIQCASLIAILRRQTSCGGCRREFAPALPVRATAGRASAGRRGP